MKRRDQPFFTFLIITVCVRTLATDAPMFHTGCPAEFKGLCRCGRVPYGRLNILSYVTNCTNTGVDEISMLTEIPLETEVVIYRGHDLVNLPANIFGKDANYGNLHIVDLSNNHIQTIRGKTFHNVANVKTLILNDNDLYFTGKDFHPRIFTSFQSLEELQLKNTFSENEKSEYLENLGKVFQESILKNLKILHLESNEIRAFKNTDIFCSLPALEELYLGNNQLNDIDFNVACLENLQKLDLGNNYIPFLQNQTLKKLDSIPGLEINLTGNPFQCDCNLIDMHQWIRTTKVHLLGEETYSCSSSYLPVNIGKKLTKVLPQDLQCLLYINTYDDHSTTPYVIVVLLAVLFGIILAMLIFKHKHSVHRLAERCTESIRNRFQYVSLDKKDEYAMDV